MSNGYATVSFIPPVNNGGTPVFEYYVMAFVGGNPTGIFATGATSPIVVPGLTNGTTYTFEVYAINLVGAGPYSVASNPVTPSTVPSPPTALVANAGNGQATVSFTAGSNGGSAITGYTATASSGQFASGDAAGDPITIPGLVNGVAVTITVVATNINGNSVASAPSNPVTPQAAITVPGPPTALKATAEILSASVAFTPPQNNGGSPITGYIITSTPPGGSGTGTASPITVSGLTAGQSYTFTGVAINSVGQSVASSPSNPVTPLPQATVPTQPLSPSAVPGNTSAVVTFNPPASNGGSAITGYQVNTLIAGVVTGSPVLGGATELSITVTGLTNGQAYTFTVQAINAVGTGPASVQTNSVTPVASPTVPTPPQNLVATAGVLSASVTFQPPASDGGSAITGYTVTASTGQHKSGASSPIVVTGLAGGTAVNFTAIATNAVGNSNASAASNTVTPKAALTISSPLSGSALPGATSGLAYTVTIMAANDTTPDSWSASGLPTGLGIASSGAHTAAITGTTTDVGNFNPSVTVQDSTTPTPQSFTANYTLSVASGSGGLAAPGNVQLLYQGGNGPGQSAFDPTNVFFIPNKPNTSVIQFSTVAGAVSYKIYRSLNGAPATFLAQVTAGSGATQTYEDDTATTCSGSNPAVTVPMFAQANGYAYYLSTVNSSNVEGPRSTQFSWWFYQTQSGTLPLGGLFQSYNNGATTVYGGSIGASGPCIVNTYSAEYDEFIDAFGNNCCNWNMWSSGFNYLTVDLWDTVAGTVYHLVPHVRTSGGDDLDDLFESNGTNGYAYTVTNPVANAWTTIKIPLAMVGSTPGLRTDYRVSAPGNNPNDGKFGTPAITQWSMYKMDFQLQSSRGSNYVSGIRNYGLTVI